MKKLLWVCRPCSRKKSLKKTHETDDSELKYRCQGKCEWPKCPRYDEDLWPVRERSVLAQIADAAKPPEIEARSVTTKDAWGRTIVVGGFGDVGGD